MNSNPVVIARTYSSGFGVLTQDNTGYAPGVQERMDRGLNEKFTKPLAQRGYPTTRTSGRNNLWEAAELNADKASYMANSRFLKPSFDGKTADPGTRGNKAVFRRLRRFSPSPFRLNPITEELAWLRFTQGKLREGAQKLLVPGTEVMYGGKIIANKPFFCEDLSKDRHKVFMAESVIGNGYVREVHYKNGLVESWIPHFREGTVRTYTKIIKAPTGET